MKTDKIFLILGFFLLSTLGNCQNQTSVLNATTKTNSVTTLRTASSSIHTWDAVNVKEYPYLAYGDGIHDDTSAIEKAIVTGRDVYFPRGTYLINSNTLEPMSNQTLFGDGNESEILSTLANANTVVLVGVSHCVVRDLFIKNNAPARSSYGYAIAIVNQSDFCTIKNCRLEATKGCLTITRADDNIIDDNDCTLTSEAYPDESWDIGIYEGGSRNRITGNRCYGNNSTYTGIMILSGVDYNSNENIVSNNYIEKMTGYGISIYLQGAVPYTVNKNVVNGNIIENITGDFGKNKSKTRGSGIYLQSAEYTTVIGNVVENTNSLTDAQSLAPGAIGLNRVSCATIEGNVIKTPQWYGIYVVKDDRNTEVASVGSVIIQGNTISAPVYSAIKIQDKNNVSVIGNSSNNGSAGGIIIQNGISSSVGLIVQNNNMSQFLSSVGLTLENSTYPIISGNRFDSCATGMEFSSSIGGMITGNNFTNNSSTDVYIGSRNSDVIYFDRNNVRSAAKDGVNDTYGMTYGANNISGQTNPYAIGSAPHAFKISDNISGNSFSVGATATPGASGTVTLMNSQSTPVVLTVNGGIITGLP